MSAATPEDHTPRLPSRLRKGRLPKFDPTSDELEEGLREVESLFDGVEASAESEEDLAPPSTGSVKYMVMRSDGTLVDVADTRRKKKPALDAEALGAEMDGFFDALEGGGEEEAAEHHSVPVVHLRSDGVADLDLEVFGHLLASRVSGCSLAEAAAEIEDLLKAVQVLGTECEPAFELYVAEGAALRGVYPDVGRSIRDGAALMSVRSQRGATGKFLKDGQKYDVKEATVLCLDVLGKFFVTQQNTITAHPEPAVAGISIDEMRATLLEGRFKDNIVRNMLQDKRIVGVGLHGNLAMVFNDLNQLSSACDRAGLKGLFAVLADSCAGLEGT